MDIRFAMLEDSDVLAGQSHQVRRRDAESVLDGSRQASHSSQMIEKDLFHVVRRAFKRLKVSTIRARDGVSRVFACRELSLEGVE